MDNNIKRKYKFCPRKNKKQQLNKNNSSHLIGPKFLINDKMNLSNYNYINELTQKNAEISCLNKFENLEEQKTNKNDNKENIFFINIVIILS